jgi:hypothetical protein
MALIPSLLRDVGALTRIFWIPCSAPASLWIEAAGPALIKAIYSVAEPDLKETYHQTVGQSLVCSIKQSITEAIEDAGGETTASDRFVFKVSEVVDEAIWTMFLAAIGADALIDWTSMVYRLQGCTNVKKWASSSDPIGGTSGSGQGTSANGLAWVTSDPSNPRITPNVEVLGNRKWFIAWGCGLADVGGVPVGCTSVLLNSSTNQVLDTHVQNVRPDGKVAKTIVFGSGVSPNDSAVHGYKVICWSQDPCPHNVAFPTHGFCSIGDFGT